ncbi:MAG: hypothetical protein IH983_12060 [Planctomycetes bacterium]|nr:hypothetical protein [Planctomycetota bacterium]
MRGGAYISEWLNALLIVDGDGRPKCTKADLERIVADDDAAPAMVIAARRILSAMKDGKLPRGGSDPEPGRDFERIADRLEGKPAQHVKVTQHAPSLDSLEAELRAMVAQDPTLPARMRAMLAEVAGPEATPLPAVIQTTAEPIDDQR